MSFSERLFPALAEHFCLKGGARSVAVHDAFVVRYEEGKQRHLPLHRDQSTHSFTVIDSVGSNLKIFTCLIPPTVISLSDVHKR